MHSPKAPHHANACICQKHYTTPTGTHAVTKRNPAQAHMPPLEAPHPHAPVHTYQRGDLTCTTRHTSSCSGAPAMCAAMGGHFCALRATWCLAQSPLRMVRAGLLHQQAGAA